MFRFATRRPVAVLMMTTAAALFGVLSYKQLGLELMPDLAYPTLTIRVDYPGAAPQEVESEIVRRIETQVGTVEALVGMHSSSRAGVAEVVLEFDWNSDMDRAAQRVRERMGRLDLPDAADTPLLLRYDPTLVPVLSLAVSGAEGLTLTRLRTYAEERLAPELSKVAGVAAVRVLGGLEREVQVQLDESAIAARGLGVAEVVERLRAANVNLAGGTLREGSVEFLVRTIAELRTPREVEKVVVLRRDGALIRLGDIARVVPTTRERTSLVRVGGREAVRVDIYRQADANIVEVCDAVRTAVFGTERQRKFVADQGKPKTAEKKKKPDGEGKAGKHGKRGKGKGKRGGGARMKAKKGALERRRMTNFIEYRAPRGASLDVLGDQSVFIRAALSEVSSAALVGGLLAVLMLYLFLQSGYPTFIIAVAIPLSIAVTFAPLKLFGVSLNVMSLGGLALGVGMLVDNSVVVLESVYRCREEGDGVVEAAIRGTREVGAAVVASTLTTVAVFFPIVFVKGVAGQVFGDLALAVVFSLLASLMVALFVVPMLASRTFALRPAIDAPLGWRVPFRALPALRERGWIGRVLFAPYALLQTVLELVGNIGVVAAALVAIPAVLLFRAVSFVARWVLWLPVQAAQGLIAGARAGYGPLMRACLRAPLLVLLVVAGTTWAAWQVGGGTGAELIPEVRQGVLVADVRFPVGTPLADTSLRAAKIEAELRRHALVERVEAFVGEPEAGSDDAKERGPHTAAITIRLAEDGRELQAREDAAMALVRAAVLTVSGAELELSRPALFSLRPPIRVVVLGHALPLLEVAATDVKAVLDGLPGVSDVRSSVRRGYPELQVEYDRQRLASLGLDARAVAERLRGQIEGEVATELRQRETRVDVRVRLDPERVASRGDLETVVVNPGQPVPLPLESVARLVPGEGPAEIRRVDGQRAAVLTARTATLDLGTTSARLDAELQRTSMPPGFEVRLRGQDEEMKTSLESLKFALLLAVFLVYVVMASQFESLRAPLVIMGTLPLAAVGVLFGLGVLGHPLSVVVFVGLITLAGIVVNNAIVLVDYANQLQQRGLSVDDALVEAGRTRLRPILMTTLTTVLALLPLAFGVGEGAELRQPMAATLIFGLVFATGLTLVVIPVLYRWVVRDSVARPAPEG